MLNTPINYIFIQKKDEFGGWFEALITDNDNCFATIGEKLIFFAICTALPPLLMKKDFLQNVDL